jgi:hypothetical protein
MDYEAEVDDNDEAVCREGDVSPVQLSQHPNPIATCAELSVHFISKAKHHTQYPFQLESKWRVNWGEYPFMTKY